MIRATNVLKIKTKVKLSASVNATFILLKDKPAQGRIRLKRDRLFIKLYTLAERNDLEVKHTSYKISVSVLSRGRA